MSPLEWKKAVLRPDQNEGSNVRVETAVDAVELSSISTTLKSMWAATKAAPLSRQEDNQQRPQQDAL